MRAWITFFLMCFYHLTDDVKIFDQWKKLYQNLAYSILMERKFHAELLLINHLAVKVTMERVMISMISKFTKESYMGFWVIVFVFNSFFQIF